MYCFLYLAYNLCLCVYWEHDKLSGKGSHVCYRCYAKRNDFLSDDDGELKTVEKRRREIKKATAGVDIPENFRNGSDEPVVGEDSSFHLAKANSCKTTCAVAVCLMKLIERSNTPQNLYPELRPKALTIQ